MVPQGLANLGGQCGACGPFRCGLGAGIKVGQGGKEEEPHWRCPWQPRGEVVHQPVKKGNALRYLGSKGCQGPKRKPRGGIGLLEFEGSQWERSPAGRLTNQPQPWRKIAKQD